METSASVLDGSPPSPSPSRSLFFRSSQMQEETPPSPPGEETTTATTGRPAPATPSDGGSASEPEWQSDEPLDLDESDPTSSTGSSADRPLKAFSKKATKLAIAKGILTGSAVLHRVAARTEGQQRAGLFLADEEDAENIADPLAAIAGRREGIAGKVSPDTADAVRAMMALANYASKQIAATVVARDLDSQLAGGATFPVNVGEGE